MHTAVETPTAERHVGLMDYVLALAAGWRMLLLVPLLVAAVVYGYAKVAPKVYTSVALVSISPDDQRDSAITPPQAALMMKSRVVLDAVLASKVTQDDLEDLVNHINPAVSKEGLVRLEVDGDSPEQAQRLAQAVLQAWLKTTLPGDRERADLQARASTTKANLANVQSAIESLTRSMGLGERGGDSRVRLADLAETANKLFLALQSVNRRLDGLPPEVIRQPPTLADRPTRPLAGSLTIKAWIGVLLVVAVVIVLRRRVDAARSDPVIDAQLRRLLRGRRKERA